MSRSRRARFRTAGKGAGEIVMSASLISNRIDHHTGRVALPALRIGRAAATEMQQQALQYPASQVILLSLFSG